MENFSKTQLLEKVREAKRAQKTCASYSKMKKQDLYDHAVSIGVIARPPPPDEKKQKIKSMVERANVIQFSTLKGKEKQNSFLRRAERVLAMDEKKITAEIMDKLRGDYQRLSSYG
jgi:hypothetical protein